MIDKATPAIEMVDILSRDGRIVSVGAVELGCLGLPEDQVVDAPWSAIYPLAARERIEELFAAASAGPHVVALELRQGTGALLPVTAIAVRHLDPAAGTCLRLVKWPRGGTLDDLARLSEEKEVLSSILETSDDAGWCMEWAEPVDLSAPEQEIIRQVFENGPRWRFCNDAMARLYRTPEGKDFNALPVHETFPRSPENEAFIRRLVRASFDVNASPSRDLRYDGVYIEVENDVRGHIRGNLLYRMWGTVRDVSKHARRAAVLREEIDALEAILGALPDALVITDRDGHLLRINSAAEELLDLSPEELPGRAFADLIELPLPLPDLFAAAASRKPGHPSRVYPARVLNPERPARADLTARLVQLRDAEYLVLCLRTRLGPVTVGEGPDRIRVGG